MMFLQKQSADEETPNQQRAHQVATASPATGKQSSGAPNWMKTEFNKLGNNLAAGWNMWQNSPTSNWLSKTFKESPVLTAAGLGLGIAGTGYAVQRMMRAAQPYPQMSRAFQQYQQPQFMQQQQSQGMGSILPWLGVAGLVGGGAYLWNRYGDRLKTMYNQAKTLSEISPDLEVVGDLAHKANGSKLRLLWEYMKMPAEKRAQISNAMNGLERLRPQTQATVQPATQKATSTPNPIVPPPTKQDIPDPEQRKRALNDWYWQQQMIRG